eukprot:1161103-Pelagomonas_calceolata.AAC.4
MPRKRAPSTHHGLRPVVLPAMRLKECLIMSTSLSAKEPEAVNAGELLCGDACNMHVRQGHLLLQDQSSTVEMTGSAIASQSETCRPRQAKDKGTNITAH